MPTFRAVACVTWAAALSCGPVPQSGQGGQAVELAELTRGDAAAGDYFGKSVAISGDRIVIGASKDDLVDGSGLDEGSASVFERGEGGWVEIATLSASDASGGATFGVFVAVHGDTAVVAAPRGSNAGGSGAGAAYVFERDHGGAGAWGEARRLTAGEPADGDHFGSSVSIWEDTIVVGVKLDDHEGGVNAGSAYVFARDQGGAGAWGELARLTASDAAENDRFGFAVAVCGESLVITAPGSAGDSGAAYVFASDGVEPGRWAEVQKLVASDAGGGDEFGCSVAAWEDVVLVGAHLGDHGGLEDVGSAYVFERSRGVQTTWTEVKRLTARNAAENDRFGGAVAISGATALVGAALHDTAGANESGSVCVFGRDRGGAGAWGEVLALAPRDPAAGDLFGSAVTVAGGTTVVGSFLRDTAGAVDAGAVYVGELALLEVD